MLLYTRTCTETTVDSARKHISVAKPGQSKPYNPQEQHYFSTQTGCIPRWTCVGTSTCPYSKISFARGLRVVKEFHANLGAAVEIVYRSSGIVFRIVTLRVAETESVKRTVQICQSFSKMHIAVPVQWQLRSQRRQLSVHVSK